jgi:hypothetical protein
VSLGLHNAIKRAVGFLARRLKTASFPGFPSCASPAFRVRIRVRRKQRRLDEAEERVVDHRDGSAYDATPGFLEVLR